MPRFLPTLQRAGVGKATLSRRFATRDELINAVFADRMDGYATAITEALADPDPWHGFTRYMRGRASVPPPGRQRPRRTRPGPGAEVAGAGLRFVEGRATPAGTDPVGGLRCPGGCEDQSVQYVRRKWARLVHR
jgi:AcrR family transcriptional regulator